MLSRTLALVALVILLRLPFLNQPIQGDDVYYLYGAEHAQIDPLHPLDTSYMFLGDVVDMRGHPHGPMNSWILATLLAALGSVREIPFHLAYTLFSVIAVLAMWSLARRFCEHPFIATLLFLAVPAFVVNGNSFEADLPFLAFWMASVALFVHAVEEHSPASLLGSAAAGALAGLTAYQAVLLTPILAVYLFQHKRSWRSAWLVVLAAPIAIGVWQLWEWSTRGALPAAVLVSYMRSYSFHKTSNTLRSAVALIVHSAWIVSPILVVAAFWPKADRWRLFAAGAAALAAAFYDGNPLFWLSVGCGVLIFTWLATEALRGDFLAIWACAFFAGALLIFFAGSARYLLPIAAPVAILAARASPPRWLAAGFAVQLALSLGLAAANYQHWDGYRKFAATLAPEAAGHVATHRVWVDAEWGLRYYLESEGALPLGRDQVIQPGDMIVGSDLFRPVTVQAPAALVASADIVPSVPLRLISLSHRSAYSSAAAGLLPFEISRGPADVVHAATVIERKPELSYLDPKDSRAAIHVLSGLFPDGWMSDRASLLLKTPENLSAVEVVVYIPPNAPARRIQLLVDGRLIAEETFPAPGPYKLSAPFQTAGPTATVTLIVDKTFSAPGDQRKLGTVIAGVGFR